MKTKTYALIALIACSVGCMSAKRQDTTPNAEIQELRAEIARLKQAQVDGYQPPGPGGLPTTSPTPPAITGPTAIGSGDGSGYGYGGGMVTASEVVRGQRAVYACFVGTEPRQVKKGRKIMIVNNYCDGGRDMGLNCRDDDHDGQRDNDSALTFEIDGKPVGTDTGGVLMPGDTCYVDIGQSRYVRLTVMRHANLNTTAKPQYDLVNVDASYTEMVGIGGNVQLHDVTENKNWSH